MHIINSNLFNILIPEKGYKLVNKTNGNYYKKVYLGINDSADNYAEEIDDVYVNTDIVSEIDNLKGSFNDFNDQNDFTIDLLLLTIDELYVSIEPVLASVPMTLDYTGVDNISKFINFYVLMVKRGLKSIDEIPERFKEDVRKLI